MLRFSIEAGPARANLSAVYALFGVVLIPGSFLAIPPAARVLPPVVFDPGVGGNLSGAQLTTLLLSLAGLLPPAPALYANELAGKRLDARLRELRELLA